MEEKKYKIRCRNKGILVASKAEKYDVVWKRSFNPKIYPMDREKTKKEDLVINNDFVNTQNGSSWIFKGFNKDGSPTFKHKNNLPFTPYLTAFPLAFVLNNFQKR